MRKTILGVSFIVLATALTAFAAPNADGPKSAREACDRGTSCLEKREYDAAITAFTEAIRLNPKLAEAFCGRGMIYALYRYNSEFDRGIADLNEAIRLDPKSAVAFHDRGVAYFRKRRFRQGPCGLHGGDPAQPDGCQLAQQPWSRLRGQGRA